MYGRRVGRLEVQIVDWCKSDGPSPLTLWEQQNEQGNKWLYEEVKLPTGFKRYVWVFMNKPCIMHYCVLTTMRREKFETLWKKG